MRIRAQPSECVPERLTTPPPCHKTDYVARVESALVMEWCGRRLRGRGGAATTAAVGRLGEQMSADVAAHVGSGGGGGDVAPVTQTLVSLGCDAVAFPSNRTTCVVYRPGGVAAVNGTKSGGGGGGGDEHGGRLPTELPVGEAYYNALCAAWRQPVVGVVGGAHSGGSSSSSNGGGGGGGATALALPPVANEDELDDSLILESIEETVSCEFNPAIPLQHMIALLVPEWEDEGLYDDVL